jgi:hypothetical protein
MKRSKSAGALRTRHRRRRPPHRARQARSPRSGTLEHWQHDTFVARWTDRELRADAFVTFALDPDGNIETVKMRAVSPDTDFSYDFQDLLFRRRQ